MTLDFKPGRASQIGLTGRASRLLLLEELRKSADFGLQVLDHHVQDARVSAWMLTLCKESPFDALDPLL